MEKRMFVSTTIPYVNGEAHIGHAEEFVEADALARFYRLHGYDVFFSTGTDENSLKNVLAAEKAGVPILTYVADYAEKFKKTLDALSISYDGFIRTTEERHIKGAQKMWNLFKKSDLEKRKYRGLYCVGCEAFLKENELVDGLCPDHKKAPETIEEENWFFKLSQYTDQIKRLLESDRMRVIPEHRKNEMLAFLKDGLEDFSVSRSVDRAHGFGVPVPGDETQIMYVWVDALSNYVNVLGFGSEDPLYEKYWVQTGIAERKVMHVLGKGVARFHLLYWIGLLLSAGMPLPTEQFIHAYITVNGEKISKSLGNAIHPLDVIGRYGVDATRHYVLGAISSYQDGDFSFEKMDEWYGAHLAHGIGNLNARVLSLVEKYTEGKFVASGEDVFSISDFWKEYDAAFHVGAFHDAVKFTNELVKKCDVLLSEKKPWERAKKGEDIAPLLYETAETIRHIGIALLPIMPETAEKILSQFGITADEIRKDYLNSRKWGGLKIGTKIVRSDALFPNIIS